MKYEHRGISIDLTDDAKFVARIGDHRVVANSLASMKKRIDKQEEFTSFNALIQRPFDRWGKDKNEPFFAVKVIGISKARGKVSYHNKDKWRLEDGREIDAVFEDSTEMREALISYFEMNKRHKEEKDVMDKRHEAERLFVIESLVEKRPKQDARK